MSKNAFTQKNLIHFLCMLHLIVAINLDPMAHKATFSHTHMQFKIRLACEEPIDLRRWVFKRIYYKATTVTKDNLPYIVIITKLLLAKRVQPQAKE